MICISKLSTTCMYVRGKRGEGRDRSSSSFMVLGPCRHEWVMVLGPRCHSCMVVWGLIHRLCVLVWGLVRCSCGGGAGCLLLFMCGAGHSSSFVGAATGPLSFVVCGGVGPCSPFMWWWCWVLIVWCWVFVAIRQ